MSGKSNNIPKVLTIAGSDSGGGAGIQADLKTFTAHKVYGMSVITSITAQNTYKVLGIQNLDPEFVGLQLAAVVTDIGIDAVKTGMLSTTAIIKTVADKLRKYKIEKIVVDPVIVSKSGSRLLDKDAEITLSTDMVPVAFLITPNIPEAEVLSGTKINSIEGMKNAAVAIWEKGAKYVLIKGGHLINNAEATDILFDGNDFYKISTRWINTKNTHGTGCTYSAAVCANLARGLDVIEAISNAKDYVTGAIENSFKLGKGNGPLNHYYNL